MRKHLLLTGLFLSLFLKLTAQQLLPVNEKAYSDSLLNILQSKQPDSVKATANFLLSDYWRAKDTVKSKTYLDQGKQLAEKSPELKALYYFYEGQYYFHRNQALAAKSFKKASEMLAPFKSKESLQGLAASWYNYGIMVRNEKGDDFIIDILLNKSVPLAEKAGNAEKIAHYYSQLGTILMYNAKFDKAEIYNKKAIDLLESKKPGSTILMLAYLSAASNHIYKGKADEAKKLLDKAKKILKPHPESTHYPNYYYNEGLYYTAKGDFKNAQISLDNGIVLAKKYGQGQLLQMLVFRKYNIFLEQKNFASARQLLLEVVKEGTLIADVNNRKTIYQQLAKTNEYLGNMGEAYNWAMKYSTLSDSLSNSKMKEKITELESKFQHAENQKKITQLESEKKEANLTASNNRLFIWLLGVVSLLLLISAIFSRVYYKNQKKLAEQKEINYQQQLKEMEQQQQLAKTEAMLEGEERERRRVARDLHDGLGGMLAGIKIKLSGEASQIEKEPEGSGLTKIIDQLDHSVSELRRIAHNMMPETLMRFGLQTALRDLCESMQTKHTVINYESYSIADGMSLPTQVAIYRIVQETLSNAIRHAEAQNITVQCSQNGEMFFITVEDDGKGFDSKSHSGKKGMGLNNIENRVKFLDGKLEINSSINEGTTVNVELNVAV